MQGAPTSEIDPYRIKVGKIVGLLTHRLVERHLEVYAPKMDNNGNYDVVDILFAQSLLIDSLAQ